MACIIDSGYELGCFSAAGARRVLVGTFNPEFFAGVTVDAESTITGSTVSPEMYVFQQEIESASLAQSTTVSRQNGAVSFEQTVSLMLQGLTPAVRNSVQMLATAPLMVIIEDNNGQYLVAGIKNGMRVSTSNFGTGLSMDDLAGASLELLGKEAESAYFISPSVAEGFIVLP